MKIVHLTSHISGGAGSLALNIYKTAKLKNEDLNILLSIDTTKDLFIVRLYTSFLFRLHDIIYWLLGYLHVLDYKHFFFTLFPTFSSKKKFEKATSNVDIFIVYWISRFYNSIELKSLKVKNPAAKFIFLNADEAHFTGGCHYKFDCENYKENCRNCPGVNAKILKKRISKEFESKVEIYDFIRPQFVLPSSTFHEEFKNSIFLNKTNFLVRPYGAYFNTEIEKFIKKRKIYLENQDPKINLIVRSSFEPRKGSKLFLDTINKILKSQPKEISKYKVHVVGDQYLIDQKISKSIETKFHGNVSRDKLFEIYAESDVLIVTSIEDSGPIMINECIGLGLHVLSTNVGVASDLINDDNGKIYSNRSQNLMYSILGLNLIKIRNYSKDHIKSKKIHDLSFEKFYNQILK